jgi:predicted O-methyltransferase YrrM
MTNFSTLQQPAVAAALDRMFAAAGRDEAAELPASPGPRTMQELADAYSGLYLPISAAGGGLLYSLVRAVRPDTIVEFGTSFGISTLYLAAAVRDNGAGRVLTTELSAAKVASARRTFAETGLDDLITVLEGDAVQTLVPHLDTGVSFVLLDGWKDLYLPLLHLLEPHLAPGTLVVADDSAMASVQPYLEYVRSPENGYQSTSFPVEDGMEISCRL